MQQRPKQNDRLDVLARVPLFAELSPAALQELAQQVIRRRFKAGEVIFSQGQACNGLYVVESGLVKLYKASGDGREQVLVTHGPGSTLSELALIDGGSHASFAAAMSKSTLLFISRSVIRVLCRKEPGCALGALNIIADRLRGALDMIEELSFATVRSRLAAYLLRAAANSGMSAGTVTVQLPSTNQELAAQIGTVRELVSRHLSQLQTKEIIRITSRTVHIRDLKALTHEATGPANRVTDRLGRTLSLPCSRPPKLQRRLHHLL